MVRFKTMRWQLARLLVSIAALALSARFLPAIAADACPAGQGLPDLSQAQTAKAVPEKRVEQGWKSLPIFIEGKRGSLIRTRYQFNVSQVMPHQWSTLKMYFDKVQTQPALAYVYPIDGTKFTADRHRIYFTLLPDQINEARIRLRAPAQGGGLAIVTCQDGRSSIYSITLPGRILTPDKSTGTATVDATGKPIIRFQLPAK